jgi:hypothetical protein
MNKVIFISILVSSMGFAKTARTIHLNDKKMETIRIVPGRSVILNFPTRPTKVIIGNQGIFAVEYVENDLAVSAIRSNSNSNLFVYLEGRRFGFDLRTVAIDGDEIILVRDFDEHKIKIKVKNG